MLVLTLASSDGDTIVATIGDTSVQFKVIYVDGSQVRIGIDAPREVEVMRGELLDRC